MPTKEEEFKLRLTGVMLDMSIADDAEARLLVGGLATRVIGFAGASTWQRFNAGLSSKDYSRLLSAFQRQGNEMAQRGLTAEVHAVEVLAVAVVARTQTGDRDVMSESERLDALIDDAIAEFNATQIVSPIIS